MFLLIFNHLFSFELCTSKKQFAFLNKSLERFCLVDVNDWALRRTLPNEDNNLSTYLLSTENAAGRSRTKITTYLLSTEKRTLFLARVDTTQLIAAVLEEKKQGDKDFTSPRKNEWEIQKFLAKKIV